MDNKLINTRNTCSILCHTTFLFLCSLIGGPNNWRIPTVCHPLNLYQPSVSGSLGFSHRFVSIFHDNSQALYCFPALFSWALISHPKWKWKVHSTVLPYIADSYLEDRERCHPREVGRNEYTLRKKHGSSAIFSMGSLCILCRYFSFNTVGLGKR